jgi:hypothetical protein
MRVLRYWRFGLGAALALSVGAAVAADPLPTYPECNKKPTPADLDGAKGAHKAAAQFYERGDYDKAISFWNAALTFDCSAYDLLINIANAYEKKGELAPAVATLEAYQKRTGLNQNIEEKIKNLKARMAPAPPTATVTAPPTATLAPTVPTVPTAVPTAAPEGQRPFGITPWIVVGGGGALALVGAILLPVGAGAVSSAESKCTNGHMGCTADAASQGNAGRAEFGAGAGLLGVGLAAAGGGLVWQLLFNKPKHAPGPAQTGLLTRGAPPPNPGSGLWVTPSAGSGRSGVVVGGSF